MSQSQQGPGGNTGPRGHLPGARQASANLLWGDVKSPKSPEIATPRETYADRLVPEQSDVDIHFESLMVSCVLHN